MKLKIIIPGNLKHLSEDQETAIRKIVEDMSLTEEYSDVEVFSGQLK